MFNSIQKMKVIIQNKIMEISLTAASFLDGDEIASLTKADKENNTEKYKKAYDTLATFHTISVNDNAGLAYIYCVVKDESGTLVFSVDPSEDPALFLEEKAIVTDAIVRAFEGTAGFDDQSYVDRWGDLYSAYAPIISKTDGTVKAVVGVDVWANWYKSEITSNAIMIGVTTVSTILLGVLVTFILTYRLRKRLSDLSQEMDELQEDVKLLITDIRDPRYIPVIKEDEDENDFASFRKQISSTRVAVKNYIEYTRQQAFIDILSGLGNRNAYYEVVEQINKKITNKEYISFAVIVLDINGLKEINDAHGHEVGDKAIIISALCLMELFTRDICYRIGGDEFVVIYQNVYETTIKEKLSQLNDLITKYSQERSLECELGLSYGYSFFNAEKDTRYRDVFDKADEKMYKQKAAYYEGDKSNRRRKK